MNKETAMALENKSAVQKQNKTKRAFRKLYAAITAATAMSSLAATTAFAGFGESVSFSTGSADATTLMENIVGILLTVTRYVGIALVIYGIYEVVMSFMQNQPEAKTKGIVMALAGVVMIGLKGVLNGVVFN